MKKEIYEALKRVVSTLGDLFDNNEMIEDLFEARDLDEIEFWLNEEGKEYKEEN